MNNIIKSALKTVLSEEQYTKMQDNHREKVRHKRELKAEKEKKIALLKKEENEKAAKQAKIDKFHETFREIMESKNIYYMEDKTITPYNISLLEEGGADGITCSLAFPNGSSVNDLDVTKKSLSQNVFGKCMIFIEDEGDSSVKFSAIKNWHDIPYKPVVEYKGKALTASQMFVGYNIKLEPIIIDLSAEPHLLITGGSGGGKSKLVEIIISNLAYNSTLDELEFYFLQLVKDDNFKFEILKHCRGCVTATSENLKIDNYKKALAMLRYIDEELLRRGTLVKSKLGRKSEDLNIHVYNKKFPHDKLPVLQLWVDEAASLYKKTSNKNINKILEEAQEIIERIASAGRYVGIYLINVLQRASKEEFSREIKINTLNWISFRQVDAGASKVAIGDETSAIGLPKRVFAFKAGGDLVNFAKTPFSLWDKNVQLLNKNNKIRTEKKEEFDNAYSHWWNAGYNEDNKEEGASELKYKKEKSKIVDAALKRVETTNNELQEKLSNANYQIEQKDETIKKLMEDNRHLAKMYIKSSCGNNDNRDDVQSSIYGSPPLNNEPDINKVYDDINSLDYTTADKQRKNVEINIQKNGLDSSPYKPVDLSGLRFSKKENKK